MGILEVIFSAAFAGENLHPITGISTTYKHWESIKDFKRCVSCYDMHGKIWRMEEDTEPSPPLHVNCRCKIVEMTTIEAGTATINGIDGADWQLKNKGNLPEYYVSFEDALSLGWKRGKNLARYVPNKMLTGGVYYNDDGHLPQADGRIWYEADINYTGGKRNNQRILWSNDGLIFATYDHYETFYEIV